MDRITAEEFHAAPGTEQWRASAQDAVAHFESQDFAAGARLVAKIAEAADAADHHPDVDLRYRGVTVHLTTHSEGGLTQKDVELANAISAAAAELGIAANVEEAVWPRAE